MEFRKEQKTYQFEHFVMRIYFSFCCGDRMSSKGPSSDYIVRNSPLHPLNLGQGPSQTPFGIGLGNKSPRQAFTHYQLECTYEVLLLVVSFRKIVREIFGKNNSIVQSEKSFKNITRKNLIIWHHWITLSIRLYKIVCSFKFEKNSLCEIDCI